MSWERDQRFVSIYRRPGFMLRRAHQIAVGIFDEECGALGLTTTQHGVLSALARFSKLDQISLGRLLGLDRSTVGTCLRRLEERGLVRRAVDGGDRRRYLLALTAAGRRLLAASGRGADRAQERILDAFDARERALFLSLLERLIATHNEHTRVPIAV